MPAPGRARFPIIQTVKRWLFAWLWIAAVPAWAEPESAPVDAAAERAVESGPGAARPSLSLDSLLSPRSVEWGSKEALRGGRDRGAWRREFEGARAEVTQLEGQVDEVQKKLRAASAGGGWSYSPAGAGEAVDPEVMKLRAHLRRDRASLDSARDRLRNLEVEASLAEVPDRWIAADPQ